jgi:hypothetical protein
MSWNWFLNKSCRRNGSLREYIRSGTGRDDFHNRLRAAFTSTTPLEPGTVTSTTSFEASTSSAEQINPSPLEITTTNHQTQDESRRESIRAGKQKAETVDDDDKSSGALEQQKKDLNKWREQQRKLEQQRMEERERIREQIKKDKEERKNRDARAKAAATIVTTPSQAPSSDRMSSSSPPWSAKPQQYRLQVRLFDGASVRNSFPPSATIREHIRPWLDAQRSDGTQPYTLKHILTPLPNHSITVSEEEETLVSLQLGPTANLVMVPVQSYIEAYPSSSNASLPVRAISSSFNLFSSAVGAVVGTISSFWGYGATTTGQGQREPTTTYQRDGNAYGAESHGRTVNIRTLSDQHNEDGNQNQFYNGNQVCGPLNFTPPPICYNFSVLIINFFSLSLFLRPF